MLKLAKRLEFTTTVDIHLPGEAVPETIGVTYRYLTRTEAADFNRDHEADKVEDFLHELMLGWSDVYNEDGSPVEYSHENLRRLLDVVPGAALDLYRGFNNELFGIRVKN